MWLDASQAARIPKAAGIVVVSALQAAPAPGSGTMHVLTLGKFRGMGYLSRGMGKRKCALGRERGRRRIFDGHGSLAWCIILWLFLLLFHLCVSEATLFRLRDNMFKRGVQRSKGEFFLELVGVGESKFLSVWFLIAILRK